MSVLAYSALNKIYKTLEGRFSAPDEINITSKTVTIDYTDISAGKEYSVNLGDLPEGSVLLHSQIDVGTTFSDGSANPTFSLGLETMEVSEMDFPVTRDYNKLIFDHFTLNTTGITDYQGDIEGDNTDKLLNENLNALIANFWLGGSWSVGGDMSQAKQEQGGCGTQNAGLVCGGNLGGSRTTTTEEYNGSSWSGGGALSTATYYQGTAGTQTAGLTFGGDDGGAKNVTEEYNGSSWAGGGNLNQTRYGHGGCGTQTAGLSFSGNADAKTEEYDGASWSYSNDVNTTVTGMGSAGTQTAGLKWGGSGYSLVTEEYNGSTWTAVNSLNIGVSNTASMGTQTAAASSVGTASGITATTEEYDGTSWAIGNDANVAQSGPGSCGTQSAGLTFGGEVVSKTATTEEYNALNLAGLTQGSLDLYVTYTHR